ncbi:MAG: hypothetical protein JRN23_02220 [Nitrososphaerota archaeon]|nr:hypothetical protein [Nitrososphaerota archaeon]
MRLDAATAALSLASATLLLLSPTVAHSQPSQIASLSVSPTADVVGATVTIRGAGLPPSTQLTLEWRSVDAAWVVQAIPTPQVTGIKTTPISVLLGSAETNSSGFLSAKVQVPADFGGSHFIQAFLANGTALAPKATFVVEPSFRISPTAGPAGTPIEVTATGLGYGPYSTSYHLSWDNMYVGYMTALGTHGSTNFTFYASGIAGVHYVAVYQGYPGPQYLNPQQGPPSSETQSTFPPFVPFYANFTVTPLLVAPSSAAHAAGAGLALGGGALASMAVLGAVAGGAVFLSGRGPVQRKGASRAALVGVLVVLVAVAGVGIYATVVKPQASASSSSQSPQPVTFTPVATVYRPEIVVPVSNATSGPRISVTPDIASVGENVTVKGQGFSPGAQLPITWSTRQGNNLIGYKQVYKPLRNATAGSDGSFSFTMKVPADLGGIHYVSAGNLTEDSNGTLFIQRSATLSTTEGPQGTVIQVVMQGVGWDFNTNIVAVDYDNSYIGYGCGFNSGGNVTIAIVASGSPGVQTIDVYPSVWWGPSDYQNQSIIEYRYPLLTPQDHPELMPSFHFTFLMTAGNATQAQATVGGGLPLIASPEGASALAATGGLAALYLYRQGLEAGRGVLPGRAESWF